MLYALYYPQETEDAGNNGRTTESKIHVENGIEMADKKASESPQDQDAFSIAISESFQFTVERMRHVQGEWRSMTVAAFPKFRFLYCENDEAEKLKENHVPLISIPDELAKLLYELSDRQHHIPMSKGIIKSGKAHVTEGPLTGHDSQIMRVDRHKRLAWLRISEKEIRNFTKYGTDALIAGLELTERIP
ncbi:MAG: hypothetical protein LUI87_13890 [Lachnospiraceae bacterium]|nr:hypothetical protein [Lachnospiraceae bacterium]